MAAETHAFSRPFDVATLASEGTSRKLQASPEECAAIAALTGISSLEDLTATLAIEPQRSDVIHVSGELVANLHQVCVVSLEPFAVAMREPIDIRFAPPEKAASIAAAAADDPDADDPPDPYIDGVIDLGAITVEFLALSLDPYPRKPGVAFEYGDNIAKPSPFSALSSLVQRPKS